MSSSFVKDCSDVSGSGSSNSNKTVIIIVNNEAGGNVSLDGTELQTLLASHGATDSQVSVVQMGSGGNAVSGEANPALSTNIGGLAAAGTPAGVPLNFMLDGFPTIPLEGSTLGGGYAELPLDADALQRLESVLETEAAKHILGAPLIDIVNDPDRLADQFENLMPADNEGNESSPGKKKRSTPKRRSQRQMDKAEREEVVKILAENQLMLQKEREELLRQAQEQQQQEEESMQTEEKEDRGTPEEGEEGKKDPPPTGGKKTPQTGGKGKGGKKTPTAGKKVPPSTGSKGKKAPPAAGGKGKGSVSLPTKGVKGGKGKGSISAASKEKGKPSKIQKEAPKKAKKKIPQKTDSSKALKGVKIRELSVKVKKLSERLLLEKSQDEAESSDSEDDLTESPRQEESPTPEEGVDLDNSDRVESIALPAGDLGKAEEDSSPPLAKPIESSANDKTAPESVATQKGSKSPPHSVVVVKGTPQGQSSVVASSLSEVQSRESQSDSSKVNRESQSDSSKVNHLSPSDMPDTFRPCGDSAKLSDKQSDIMIGVVDSNENCKQILMPTQNFSDEAHTVLNRQRSEVTDNKQTPPDNESLPYTEINDSTDGTNVPSAVKNNLKSKNTNKMAKNVEVLNPKEKNEVFILNSVIAKYQKGISAAGIAPDNAPQKVESPTKESLHETKSTNKEPLKNKSNKGNFVDVNTEVDNDEKKDDDSPQKLLSKSPSISKSLMNYKIPLKKPANKRPFSNQSSNTHATTQHKQTKPPLLKPQKAKENTTPPTQTESDTMDTSDTLSQTHPLTKKQKKFLLLKKKKALAKKNSKHEPTNSASSAKSGNLKAPNSQSNHASSPQNKNKLSLGNHPKIIKVKNKFSSIIKLKKKSKEKDSNEIDSKVKTKETLNKVSGAYGLLSHKESKTSPSKSPEKFRKEKPAKMSAGGSHIRRSERPPVKKKKFEDILYLDERTAMGSDDENEASSDEADSDDDNNRTATSHMDDEEEEEEDEDDDEDDPEKLWCICQKPHNNRFMICCDRCEDWFHGSCVGVTKPMGRQMEEQQREWICPNCRKAERAIRGLASPPTREAVKATSSPEVKITKVVDKKAKVNKSNELAKREKTEPRVLVYEKATGIVLSGTAAPTLDILPDWLSANPAYTTLQPSMMNSIKFDSETGLKRIDLAEFGLKVERPTPRKMDRSFSFQDKIDSGSPASAKKEKATKNRVTKLLQTSEVQQLKKLESAKVKKALEEAPKMKKKLSSSEFYGKERKDSTSSEKGDKHLLQRNSSVEDGGSSKKSMKAFIKDGAPKKVSQKESVKSPDAVVDRVVPKSDVMRVRHSVRKMLLDALLKKRAESKGEFEDLKEEAIKETCKEIEEHLYINFNKDIGFKYKARYRSLVFNIRDSKNGLFRNILRKTIAPKRLASMTSEELASKELAEWREREEKKELEAIQKAELERIALGNQYIMKSHKGEIVIDKDELQSKGGKDTESVISLASNASKSLSEGTAHRQEDEEMMNHRNHIYDPSCKICSASQLQEIANDSKGESTSDERRENGTKEEEERTHKKEKRRDSDSHHSKHKKRDRERERRHSSRDRERERRHSSHKSRDRDKERDRDKDRERDKARDRDRDRHKDKEKERRSSHHERRSSKEDRRREERKREEKKRRDEDGKEDEREAKRTKENGFGHREKEAQAEAVPEGPTESPVVDIRSTTPSPLPHPQPSSSSLPSFAQQGKLIPSADPLEGLLPSADPLEGLLPPEIPAKTAAPITAPSYSPPDRSPATPPLPAEMEDDDIELLSPATPPLPDEEDRLTPPPKPAQKKPTQSHIWKGLISMPDVAKFTAAAFEVSGKALFFTGDVPSIAEVVGRINPDTVWSYIAQMKKSGSKEILVVRFQPSSEEEKVSYIALYSYLSSKKRYGVIGNCEKAVKDFYVVPLASHQPIPQVLLPLDGPGFEESRPHMLIGVIVRTKHRRIYDPIKSEWATLGLDQPKYNSQVKDSPAEDDSERSYTPPPAIKQKDTQKSTKRKESTDEESDEVKEKSPDSAEAPNLEDDMLTPSPLSTDGIAIPPPDEDDKVLQGNEAKAERESMLAELNRQIERDRKELTEMQKRMDEKIEKERVKKEGSPTDTSDWEGDSPIPVVEPEGEDTPVQTSALDTISLPSNLHEILNSIKKKEEAIKEKENEIKRRLNLADDVPGIADNSSGDVDLRVILGTGGKDQDMRILTAPRGPPQHGADPRVVPSSQRSSGDIDFRSRDPRIPREIPAAISIEDAGANLHLNRMSDADLVAKAREMEVPPSDLGARPNQPIYHIPHGPMGPGPAPGLGPGPAPGPAPGPIAPPLYDPRPPHPEGLIPPNPGFVGHSLPPPFRPHGDPRPFGPPPGGPPMGGPPLHRMPLLQAPPFRPTGPHYGPPRPGPPEEYGGAYPPHVDENYHHRMDEGRGPRPRRGTWEPRGGRRDTGYRKERWDRAGPAFPEEGGRKRRWKDGGGRPPSHPRSRWGEEKDEWRGGEDRRWRKDGKRPRNESRDDFDEEEMPREIDY